MRVVSAPGLGAKAGGAEGRLSVVCVLGGSRPQERNQDAEIQRRTPHPEQPLASRLPLLCHIIHTSFLTLGCSTENPRAAGGLTALYSCTC